MHKTRRTWLPNIQSKRLHSETLGQKVKLEVTTRTLRTIDKYGGLDAYLLGIKDTQLSDEAMRLRIKIRDLRRQKLAGTEGQTLSLLGEYGLFHLKDSELIVFCTLRVTCSFR